MCQNHSIVSVAVIVAVGVNTDERREVLGLDIGPSEAENVWTEFLCKLAQRGLCEVKLVISDAHDAEAARQQWRRVVDQLRIERGSQIAEFFKQLGVSLRD